MRIQYVDGDGDRREIKTDGIAETDAGGLYFGRGNGANLKLGNVKGYIPEDKLICVLPDDEEPETI